METIKIKYNKPVLLGQLLEDISFYAFHFKAMKFLANKMDIDLTDSYNFDLVREILLSDAKELIKNKWAYNIIAKQNGLDIENEYRHFFIAKSILSRSLNLN